MRRSAARLLRRLRSPADEDAAIELWRRTWQQRLSAHRFRRAASTGGASAGATSWSPVRARSWWPSATATHARLRHRRSRDRAISTRSWWRRKPGAAASRHALLDEAKRLSPRGLDLHVNQDNARAIRFYEKHGLPSPARTSNPRSGAPIHGCAGGRSDDSVQPRDSRRSGTAASPAARRGRRRRPGSSCVPSSTMRPWSITRMRSQDSTVASRCAMTSVVRSSISCASAACTSVSLSASSDEVASSSSSSGASRRIARAMAMRWRWPPESVTPRSPICVSKPCGRRRMNSVGVRELGGALDLGVARVRPAEADVVGDRSREHHGVLRHQRDARAQIAPDRHRRAARRRR